MGRLVVGAAGMSLSSEQGAWRRPPGKEGFGRHGRDRRQRGSSPSWLAAAKPDVDTQRSPWPWGEDGCTVQGVLEILGVPYTHSGVLASALAQLDEDKSPGGLRPKARASIVAPWQVCSMSQDLAPRRTSMRAALRHQANLQKVSRSGVFIVRKGAILGRPRNSPTAHGNSASGRSSENSLRSRGVDPLA